MSRFADMAERVARHSDQELRELYGEMFRSKDPGLQGAIALVTKSIWDIESVNWPAVKRELAKYPSGRRVISGMEALPEFSGMSTKGYWAVMKEKGVPRIGKQSQEWLDLVRTWEDFERKVLQRLEDEMMEYYMGPGRSELKTASSRTAEMDGGKVAGELVRIAEELVAEERTAQWESLPKGWTQESLKDFYGSLVGDGDAKKKFYSCVEKVKGTDITDPESFCGSLLDKFMDPSWRGVGR